MRQGFPPGWAAAVLLPGLRRGCPAGAEAGVYAPQTEVARGKIAPENACIYKAFPGRFWGVRYVFPPAPVFAEMLSTFKHRDFEYMGSPQNHSILWGEEEQRNE